jgi:hypothetical protein
MMEECAKYKPLLLLKADGQFQDEVQDGRKG